MSLAIADTPEGPYTKYPDNPILKAGPWGSWDDGGYSEGEVYFKDGMSMPNHGLMSQNRFKMGQK